MTVQTDRVARAKQRARSPWSMRPGHSPDAVPLYDNLGSLHHEITTDVPSAQEYFDQGLRWLYAFNHAAAAQSSLSRRHGAGG